MCVCCASLCLFFGRVCENVFCVCAGVSVFVRVRIRTCIWVYLSFYVCVSICVSTYVPVCHRKYESACVQLSEIVCKCMHMYVIFCLCYKCMYRCVIVGLGVVVYASVCHYVCFCYCISVYVCYVCVHVIVCVCVCQFFILFDLCCFSVR